MSWSTTSSSWNTSPKTFWDEPHISTIKEIGEINFPPQLPDAKIYMHDFWKGKFNTPIENQDIWQPIINQMLQGLDILYLFFQATCFVMIDSGDVKKGEYHRRPGKHIDGEWICHEMGENQCGK